MIKQIISKYLKYSYSQTCPFKIFKETTKTRQYLINAFYFCKQSILLLASVKFQKISIEELKRRIETLQKQGENQKALAEINQALEIDSNNCEILCMKIMTLILQDQLFEAEKLCNIVVNNFPQSSEALDYLGFCLQKQHKFDEAMECYNKSIQLNNSPGSYYLKAKLLMEMQKFEEVVDVCDIALKIDSKEVEFYKCKATALAKLDKDDETLECCEDGLSIDSNNEVLLLLKANVLQTKKQFSKAIECFNQLTIKNPQDHLAYYFKGICLGKEGKHKEAIESFEQALKIDSKFYPALGNKGSMLLSLFRLEEAIGCLDEAIKGMPDSPFSYYDKGIALLYLGKEAEAIFFITEALKRNHPQNEEMKNLLSEFQKTK